MVFPRSIDDAGYVVWRKTDGTSTGYSTWRTHFGQTFGSGSGVSANAAVPEPATLTLLMVAIAGLFVRRKRGVSQVLKLVDAWHTLTNHRVTHVL